MFLEEIVLCPTEPESVRRLLEQREDGSLLFSCVDPETRFEEIRLLETSTQEDKLIFINPSGLEIVNASLNPDGDVIAYTLLCSVDEIQREESSSDNETSLYGSSQNSDTGSDDTSYDDSFHLMKVHNWDLNNAATRTGHEQTDEEEPMPSFHLLRGKYSSHIADVHPTTWQKKFDSNQSLYQKVIFTNSNIKRTDRDTTFKENRILFITYKKAIGLYSIILRLTESSDSDVEKEIWTMPISPKSILITRKPFWCQWDAVFQRLYFVTISSSEPHDNISTSYTTTLSCEQLVSSDVWTERMFSFKIDLGYKDEVIFKKASHYTLFDMDQTVSSPEVNMKLLNMKNGGICLAWQMAPYSNEESLYKIFLVDKNILLTCYRVKDFGAESLNHCEKSSRIFFAALGNNVISCACGDSSFFHLLAVTHISLSEGQFHRHSHYLTDRSVLESTTSLLQLPFSLSQGKSDEVLPMVHVYDPYMNRIIKLSMDKDLVCQEFFDQSQNINNRLAVTRFGRLAFEEFSGFQDILLSFSSSDMILHGQKFLGTLLIQYVIEKVSSDFPVCPFLRHLLPFAVPIAVKDLRNFNLILDYNYVQEDIKCQVIDAVKDSENLLALFKDSYGAFCSGSFTPYDNESVSADLEMLSSEPNASSSEKKILLERIEEIYDKEIVKALKNEERSTFLFCHSSRDDFSRNVIALTYEKFFSHLAKFINDKNLVKDISSSYVLEQQGIVNHFMNLFVFTTAVDNKKKSLFKHISKSEKELLQLLKRLSHTCIKFNYPQPSGLNTYLTCLTFRSCVTTYLLTFEDFDEGCNTQPVDSPMYEEDDVTALSFEFFQHVDTRSIELTEEFVAQLLDDVPDHELFGPLIQEVFNRTLFSSNNISEEMKALWDHPHAKMCLAHCAMKRLQYFSDYYFVKGSDRFRRGSIMPPITPTQFKPLDTFLDHVRKTGERYNVRMTAVEEATMQNTIRNHGISSLKVIDHK